MQEWVNIPTLRVSPLDSRAWPPGGDSKREPGDFLIPMVLQLYGPQASIGGREAEAAFL